jgi:dienelactone hydrolase
MRVLLVLFLLGPGVAREAATREVTLTTADGLRLAATWHLAGPVETITDRAAVICLPMYRSDRRAWLPLVPAARAAGLDLLAVDLRGHGDSARQGEQDLGAKVLARDPELFNAMWQDVRAAFDHLVGQGFDSRRIGAVGASVGCSVAIQAVTRGVPLRAVAVMTPGTGYLGVDTATHIRTFTGPLLLLSSAEERRATDALAAALAARADYPALLWERRIVPGSGIHGTRMFGVVEGIETQLAAWCRDRLAPPPPRQLQDPGWDATEPPSGTVMATGAGGREALAWRAASGAGLCVGVRGPAAPQVAAKVQGNGWRLLIQPGDGAGRGGAWGWRTELPLPAGGERVVVELEIVQEGGDPPREQLRLDVPPAE